MNFVGFLDVSLSICAVTEGKLGVVLPNMIKTRADVTHRSSRRFNILTLQAFNKGRPSTVARNLAAEMKRTHLIVRVNITFVFLVESQHLVSKRP